MPIAATIAGGLGMPFVPILQVWFADDGMSQPTVLRVGLGYGLYAAGLIGALGLAVALADQGGLLWSLLLAGATFYTVEPAAMWLTRGFSPVVAKEAEEGTAQARVKVGVR